MTRAEDKYDLALVPTVTDKPIKHQPWYKERLKEKRIKETPGHNPHPHLVGSEWTFVKDGLDDFRDGYPPEPTGGGLIKPVNGVAPQLQSYHRQPKQQVKPNLTKHQVLYSKTLPGQERRRAYLDSLIDGLKQHPLALYSHIEESVPPELFEELIDVLDKEMKLGDVVTDEEYNQVHYEDEEDDGGAVDSPASVGITHEKIELPNAGSVQDQGAPRVHGEDRLAAVTTDDASVPASASVKNDSGSDKSEEAEIDLLARCDDENLKQATMREDARQQVYSWPSLSRAKELWDQVDERELRRNTATGGTDGANITPNVTGAGGQSGYKWYANPVKPQHSTMGSSMKPPEDEHIQAVTKSFCDWVAELGGESNNIDESTVTGLFSGGYESKPALSVPIHVVELTNVPPELRMNSAAPGQSRLGSSQTGYSDSKLLNPGYIHTKPVKPVRYGAWYLKPKQWKALKPGEDISDPNQKEGTFSDSKKRSAALDAELSNMHGAKEFIKFIRQKGNTVPDFLARVAAMQQQTEEVQQGGGGSPNVTIKPGTGERTKTPTASRGTASEKPTPSRGTISDKPTPSRGTISEKPVASRGTVSENNTTKTGL